MEKPPLALYRAALTRHLLKLQPLLHPEAATVHFSGIQDVQEQLTYLDYKDGNLFWKLTLEILQQPVDPGAAELASEAAYALVRKGLQALEPSKINTMKDLHTSLCH